MIDYIIIAIIIAVVGGASFYIYRAKKQGQKCIGCPHSKTCSGGCSCSESVGAEKNKEN